MNGPEGTPPKRFYTPEEVAEIMKVEVKTVRTWCARKQIIAFRLPGSRLWRIPDYAIDEFSKSQLGEAGNEQ